MRCAACKRPIFTEPTVTLQSRGTRTHYGPVCARRLGLTFSAVKQAARRISHGRRCTKNTTQLDLFQQPEHLEDAHA